MASPLPDASPHRAPEPIIMPGAIQTTSKFLRERVAFPDYVLRNQAMQDSNPTSDIGLKYSHLLEASHALQDCPPNNWNEDRPWNNTYNNQWEASARENYSGTVPIGDIEETIARNKQQLLSRGEVTASILTHPAPRTFIAAAMTDLLYKGNVINEEEAPVFFHTITTPQYLINLMQDGETTLPELEEGKFAYKESPYTLEEGAIVFGHCAVDYRAVEMVLDVLQTEDAQAIIDDLVKDADGLNTNGIAATLRSLQEAVTIASGDVDQNPDVRINMSRVPRGSFDGVQGKRYRSS